MWCQRSLQVHQSERPLNTIWPLKVANQAANGSAGACWLVLPARWPARHRISDGSDQIAKKQSGPAASVCRPLMAAGRLKTGLKSRPLFSKKWGSMRANTPGQRTVIHIKTTIFISDYVESEATACYGIRSTQQGARSKLAANWRSNLT